jgi:hypothetical protein
VYGSGNDAIIVYMSPQGELHLVAHAGARLTDFGSPANLPGLPADAVFSTAPNDDFWMFAGGGPAANSRGQMLLNEKIAGTGIIPPSDTNPFFNSKCLFAWDPIDGLMLLSQSGTTYPGMGLAQDAPNFTGANGEGGSYSLRDNGWAAFRVFDNYGNSAAFRTRLPQCGTADFDNDGDAGTDADIEAFFACLAGTCPRFSSADFDRDGDAATDADIEAFFRVLAGGSC